MLPDEELLTEENIDQVDVFIALTNEDENQHHVSDAG